MLISFSSGECRLARVLVLGDLMLDKFIQGQVDRISPEAPIPVFRSQSSKIMPGGAANVAVNAAALGARAHVIGFAAEDAEGLLLRDLLARGPFPVGCDVFTERDRPTTVKTRYIAAGHQMLRVDFELSRSLMPQSEAILLETLPCKFAEADVVIISDYAKGLLTDRVIECAVSMAKEVRKPIIVDPKRTDFSIYRGATFIKPNLAELRQATKMDCSTPQGIADAAQSIISSTGADVLVTNSAFGMSLFRKDQPTRHVSATVREVYDVSGAGDTAIAAFAVAIARGYDAFDAMRHANAAAGVAVTKLGTAIVTAQELTQSLEAKGRHVSQRILTREAVSDVCRDWRNKGLTIGFTNGCFDILHAGHVSLLARAASECDRLVVGLNSDASVKQIKGETRPAQSELSRAEVLAALHVVDAVVLFNEDSPLELITALRPNVLVKGADYGAANVVGADFVQSYGGRLVLVDLLAGHSTTNILRRAVSHE